MSAFAKRRPAPSPRPLGAIAVAVLGLGVSLASACHCSEPQPVLVTDQDPIVEIPVRPQRTGPFKDPNVEPPDPRSEPQLEASALAATIAKGRKQAAAGQTMIAINTLRQCANRVPQSLTCEAELALLFAEAGTHKAHANYYLDEAARVDAPELDDGVYRQLGEAALKRARFDAAASALGIVTARGNGTANDYAELARALQHGSTRLDEAIAALARAYELDPTQHEWLRKRGVLLAQTEDTARAIEAFEQYIEAVGEDGPQVAGVKTRLAELRAKVNGGG
jgi:tetratricopeptide (TPR) repeat protein